MVQLKELLNVPHPTCKVLALPAPEDDHEKDDQGQQGKNPPQPP